MTGEIGQILKTNSIFYVHHDLRVHKLLTFIKIDFIINRCRNESKIVRVVNEYKYKVN